MAGLLLLLSLAAASADEAPTLTLLDLGPAPEEDALAGELRLSGVQVALAPAEDGFMTQSLPARLESLRDGLAPGEAIGWLTVEEARLSVSVSFLTEDRAVVRVATVDRARPEPVAELALATREILRLVREPAPAESASATSAPDPSQPAADAVAPWSMAARAGLVLPTHDRALGARGGVDVEIARALDKEGRLRVGLSAGVQVGDQSWRITPKLVGQAGMVGVGLGADVAVLPWVTRLQPRIELGVAVPLPAGLETGVALRIGPLRDEIIDGNELVYSSGWTEIVLHVGARRQIGSRRAQEGL